MLAFLAEPAGQLIPLAQQEHRIDSDDRGWGCKDAAGAAAPAGVGLGPDYATVETRVMKKEADRTSPSKLEPPLTGLKEPAGLAVDSAGALYVADQGTNRVLKFASGAKSPTALPFTGLNYPGGVAVDAAGNVYVTDQANPEVQLKGSRAVPQVLKLPAH
jgi:DNA-binding beta-propeller fold protein YncE